MACDDPVFTWDRERECYSVCHTCGDTVWDHEEFDLLRDLKAHMRWLSRGAKGIPPPPLMRRPRKDQR